MVIETILAAGITVNADPIHGAANMCTRACIRQRTGCCCLAEALKPYLVEVNLLVNFQLFIKVFTVGPHPLTELKPALNVCGVNEIVHVQHVPLANGCCFTKFQHLHSHNQGQRQGPKGVLYLWHECACSTIHTKHECHCPVGCVFITSSCALG